MERLTVEDLLLIAEAALGIPAEQLARRARLTVAAAVLAAPFERRHGRDRHPTLADKAAALAVRIARDRPLPRGNEAVALLAMLELVVRNHGIWQPPAGGQDELAERIELLAAGELSEAAFASWVRARIGAVP